MNFLPWRVKAFCSSRFPLLYHLAVNAGTGGNSASHWDNALAHTWNDASRNWPTKNMLVRELTKSHDYIIDLACGNGSILRYLQEAGYQHLHGLEISRLACERLGAAGIRMYFGKLPRIALPDARYDVVIASQVLEHIIRRRLFLREVVRVLRSNGRALVFVPDNCLGPIDEPEHCIIYNAGSLSRFLGRYFGRVEVKSMRDANHPGPVLFAHCEQPYVGGV